MLCTSAAREDKVRFVLYKMLLERISFYTERVAKCDFWFFLMSAGSFVELSREQDAKYKQAQ